MHPLNLRLIASAAMLLTALSPAPATAGTDFKRALQSKDAKDLTLWGRRFEHGEGVERNLNNAIRLYCKAAASGNAEAQYQLGWIYAMGRVGSRDDGLAAAWFYRAARNKDAHAKRMLTRLGYEGRKPKRKASCQLVDGGQANNKGQRVIRGASARSSADFSPSIRHVSITRRHPAQGELASLIRRLAPEYDLSPDLVLAVVEQESGFNPRAQSHKNAQGLMQLIPATAERFGVRNVWDPEQNIRGGMSYLRWLMARFDNKLNLVLAAYNAGEGAVERHGGVPPYAETRKYVKRILGRLN